MRIIEVRPGTPEWAAHRRSGVFNASDAPAMSGASKYKTRNQLLAEYATGVAPEVDAATQARFDAGHAAEALARPLAEQIIGEDLYSITGVDGELSASFDGLTIAEDITWEHKALNDELRACQTAADLHPMYRIQMEQQLMVSGAGKCLFMASKWDGDTLVEEKHFWYKPDAELRAKIVAGWAQFKADLAHYQHVEVIPAAIAAPVMALPALSIQVTGQIALVDNLKVFGERLQSFIESLDKSPSDDQGFADAEQAVKVLGEAEKALTAAKASALTQTASIDEMSRTVALYAEQARTARLALEKLVKARKEQIRLEIVASGKEAFVNHLATLNKRIGKPYMPLIPSDFAGVIKGKKSIASLKDAVDTELARVKIESNAVADRIQLNMTTLTEKAAGLEFLFNDIASICIKPNGDFMDTVNARVAAHKEAEAKRLEAEREKIRAEEAAKRVAEQQRQERLAQQAAREIEEANRKAEAQRVIDLTNKEQNKTDARAAGISISMPLPTGPGLLAITPTRNKSRPSDDQIVLTLANHYGVDERTVMAWIMDMAVFQERSAA